MTIIKLWAVFSDIQKKMEVFSELSSECIDPKDWSPFHDLIDFVPRMENMQWTCNWNLSPSITKCHIKFSTLHIAIIFGW